MKENIEAVISGVLKTLRIPFTKKELVSSILSHPYYPSLAAVTDILRDYGVNNLALKLDFKRLIEEAELPVVVHLKERNGLFGLLHRITEEEVTLTIQSGSTVKYPVTRFKEVWSGILLLVEKDDSQETLKEPYSQRKVQPPEVKVALICAVILCFIAFSMQMYFSVPISILLAIKLLGVVVTVLLLAHELGEAGMLSDKLCTLTKSTGCNEVLNSKASSLFGLFKLSDVGIAYFVSTLLALLWGMAAGSPHSMVDLLVWLPVFSIPYLLFSVIYQLAVVKKWCPFCMAVIGLLVAEIAAATVFKLLTFEWPSIASLLLYGWALLIAVVFLVTIKPLLKRVKENDRYKYLYTRLKRKPEVIKGILSEKPQITIQRLEGELLLGNPDAAFTITEVVNPYCGPCSTSYGKLSMLLRERWDSVKVQLRFLVDGRRDDPATQVAAHMLTLAEHLPVKELQIALDDWFREHDVEKWVKEFPAAVEERAFVSLEYQKEWAESLSINATPTIYVNGYRWEIDLDLYDLKYSL